MTTNQSKVAEERAAIECLCEHVEQLPEVMQHTPYKTVTVALSPTGGWSIEYDREYRGEQ